MYEFIQLERTEVLSGKFQVKNPIYQLPVTLHYPANNSNSYPANSDSYPANSNLVLLQSLQNIHTAHSGLFYCYFFCRI